jgi:hypothetical protein
MNLTTRIGMAELVRRIFTTLSGTSGEFVPGPFDGSDAQLVLTLPNGALFSVLPDVDVPAMYEIVRLETMVLVGDKLTSSRVIDLLMTEAGLAATREGKGHFWP